MTTSPAGTRPDIVVEMQSSSTLVCGVRELAVQAARRSGFPDAECARVGLAVDEAITNIIRHGYDKAPGRPIWMKVWLPTADLRELRIVMEDEARQVDPATIRSRDLADIRPGGLGVHIIREVMDSVVYEVRNPAGMRLTMMKKAPPGKGGCCEGGCDGRA